MEQDDRRRNLWMIYGFLAAKDTEKIITNSIDEWFKEIDELIIKEG